MSEKNTTSAITEVAGTNSPSRRAKFHLIRKKALLQALMASIVAAAIPIGLVYFSFDVPLKDMSLLPIFSLILGLFLVVYPILLGSRATDEQRAAAEVLEAKAEKEETLVDYMEAQLIAAAARQEVAVRTAQGRANRLSSVGIILMVSSVLVPFALVYLYMSLPPVTPATPAGAAPQRDWHLLLAGISFGLLFIAAARGILLAEGRQREVYAREVRETAYYGDLRRALGMAQRLDREYHDGTQKATREVVEKIMTLMLERGPRDTVASPAPDTPPASEHEFLKILADAVKK